MEDQHNKAQIDLEKKIEQLEETHEDKINKLEKDHEDVVQEQAAIIEKLQDDLSKNSQNYE